MSGSTKKQYRLLSNSEIKLIKSLQLAKHRKRLGLFVAEGEKLIAEMLPSYHCRLLIGTESLVESILDRCQDSISESIILPDIRQLERVSGMKTPPPLMALCEIPPVKELQIYTLPTLLLDDVQDPGNIGTLLRTCDWMGIRQVICTDGCADIYSPKVLQATMGALARVQVYRYSDRVKLIKQLQQTDIPIIGTFIEGEPLRMLQIPAQQPFVLILGNEGNGIASDLSALASQRITIPSPVSNHCESLNVSVAGAIILAHLML